jgi:pilus assembly protein CpaB
VKGKTLVVLAIVLGVVAVFLVNSRFGELEQSAHPKTTTFYKATADILPGVTLKDALEGKQRLLRPVGSIPEPFAKSYPEAVDESQLGLWEGKKIERPVRVGEFLKVTDLKPYEANERSAALQEGQSTVAIPVSADTAVGFQIAPGDVVDVYLSRSRQDPKAPGGQTAEAEVVVADVTVYATGDVFLTADPMAPRVKPKTYTTVTLALKGDQVPKVIAAKDLGRLTLALKKQRPS